MSSKARLPGFDIPDGGEQFLGIVSHELRSPLNGIKSWAHVLESHVHGSDDPTIARAIAGIMIGVEQQVRLIDDLLDVTRAISGDLGFAMAPMALAPAIVEAVEGLGAAASDKGVRLVLDPELPRVRVEGDPVRIQQIVSHLVDNAIKFTPSGGTIRVGITVAGDMARVEVRDNAPGPTSDRRHQGVGIALAHHLARLHGGHITRESEGDAGGSAFVVHLPRSNATWRGER